MQFSKFESFFGEFLKQYIVAFSGFYNIGSYNFVTPIWQGHM